MMGLLINFITAITLIIVTTLSENVVAFPVQDSLNSDLALRIAGGRIAKDGQFPYAAGVIVKDHKGQQSLCGGSLISSTSILTAAHCLDGAASAEIILGANNISDRSINHTKQTFESTEFIFHPRYGAIKWINDLAIIKLPRPAKLNDHHNHVKLINVSSNDKKVYDGKFGIAMGWGHHGGRNTGIDLTTLRYESNKILSNADCIKSDSDLKVIIKDTHICQSGIEGKSPCNGDSGGPLVVEGVQVGVHAFGTEDCGKGHPSVFTRLSKYIAWIKAHS